MIKFLVFTDLHYDYTTHGDERIRQISLYQVLGNHDVKVDLHQTMEFLGLDEPYYSFTHGDTKFLF